MKIYFMFLILSEGVQNYTYKYMLYFSLIRIRKDNVKEEAKIIKNGDELITRSSQAMPRIKFGKAQGAAPASTIKFFASGFQLLPAL